MNSRGLLFVAVTIVVVTAFSAAIATAQNTQQAESSDLVAPNNSGTFDTGFTQESTTFMPGKTDTNRKNETINPRPKQPREKREPNNTGNPTPTEAAPIGSSGGSSIPSNSSGGALQELPRTGGPGA